MRSITAKSLVSSVTPLLDALDKRINSNTLLLAVETDDRLDNERDFSRAVNAWLNSPFFLTMLEEAEQLREWNNRYYTAVNPANIIIPLNSLTAEDLCKRLWWLLQEAISFYDVNLEPQTAHSLIVRFLQGVWGETAVHSVGYPAPIHIDSSVGAWWQVYDLPISSLQEKLHRYFDGFEHDTATIWANTHHLYLLLTNGSD
jgi:hypothetical protein